MHPFVAQKILSVVRGRVGLTVVALIGVLVSAGLFFFIDFSEQERIRQDVGRRAAVRHALLRETLQGYISGLHGFRLLFENSSDVSAGEFTRAATELRQTYPGILAVQWVPIVKHEERDRFIAVARKAICPDFEITEKSLDGQLVPASQRPSYAPILFTHPTEGNLAAIGFDLFRAGSAPSLDRARATGDVVLTPRVPLVQSHEGAIITCSIRRPDWSVADDSIDGFTQIVLRLDELVRQPWLSLSTDVLDVRMIDITDPRQPASHVFTRLVGEGVLFADTAEARFRAKDTVVEDLSIGGRTLRVFYRARDGWIADQGSGVPYLALIGTLVLTLVTTSYLRTLQDQTNLIRRQVDERTAELRHTQALLEDDIRKREAAEKELHEKRRQLDSLLSRLPGMAYRRVADPAKPPLFASQGSADLMDYAPEELTSGQVSYLDHLPPDDRARYLDRLSACLERREPYEIEYRLHDRHGLARVILDRGEPVFAPDNGPLLFIEGLAVDITALRQAEHQKLALERKLLETQKSESLGILAGGIAHDFNNLLTGILGNTSLARLELSPSSLPSQHLQHVEQAALRAAELCQQMLAYSGRGRFSIEEVALAPLVRDTLPLLSLSLSKQARLHTELDDALPPVVADAIQLRQIVMNLVINASDALGSDEGDITVRTGLQAVDRALLARCVQEPDIPPGEYVFLEVADTGMGMSPDTLPKIFDPFFTTKFAGRGLGLAAVLGIVRGHHGALRVTSTPGAGSAFRLFLPAARKPAEVNRRSIPATDSANPTGTTNDSASPSRPARVLVVDDDAGVRTVCQRLLTSFGMSPVPTCDGDEALNLFRSSPDAYDLVLLDLTMPGLTGDEVLRRLRAIRADIPVLLMSGFSEVEAVARFRDTDAAFLQKPFTIEGLRAKLQGLLDSRRT